MNSAGIPVAGDDISEEETTDPLTLPRPDSIRPQPVPDKPKALNFHGPHEFCPVQSLEKAMMTVVNICKATEQKLGQE